MHEGDLVDGGDLDVVDAGGEVVGQRRHDGGGLPQRVGAGAGPRADARHPLGDGLVVAEHHAVGVEATEPAGQLDDGDGGALDDLDAYDVGPGAGDVDRLHLGERPDAGVGAVEVDEGELLAHRHVGDLADAGRR